MSRQQAELIADLQEEVRQLREELDELKRKHERLRDKFGEFLKGKIEHAPIRY